MHFTRTALAGLVATVGLLAAATGASAAVPPAIDSNADFFGGAPASDGVTAEVGEIFGIFEKGSEEYNSNGTTTVVNFSLPEGVTIHSDSELCGELPDENCLLIIENTCEEPTEVTLDGNTFDFQIACDEGEGFVWIALVDSLLPEGSYDVNVEFKVDSYKRVKNGPNMWQIKLPEVFEVGGDIFVSSFPSGGAS
jgi:hypothetical protein